MPRKIVVYFHQRQGHREIQKDTVRHAPKNIVVLSPIKEQADIDWLIAHRRQLRGFRGALAYALGTRIIPRLPLINFRLIPKIHNEADFVYTWNCIPLNSKKPFVVELETAYAANFFNPIAFKIYKPIMKRIFLSKKCHKIVCMSEACKLSLINELGKSIENKVVVLLPYMKNHLNEDIVRKDTINFLFVGLDFERKGGRELLRAFHELEEPKARLTMISLKDEKYINMYKSDTRIQFLGTLKSRETIFKDVYPKSDVLVLPSLHECLAIATLEALSFGLGIIATNVYGLPEVVIDNYNGILLEHPFLKPVCYHNHCFVDVTRISVPQLERKLRETELFQDLYLQLKDALKEAIQNYKEWKQNSQRLFLSRFVEQKWQETFQKIFE